MTKVTIGKSFEDGVWKDINADVSLNGSSIVMVKGEKPFGGKPIDIIPLPKGAKGKHYIYREKSLSDIVRREEMIVFRMGSVPTLYYTYLEGYCLGYYDLEDSE